MTRSKITLFSAIALLLTGCGYKTVADADYPPQVIYIAAAAGGQVYTVDNVPQHSSNTPTSGSTYLFIAEDDAIRIPLSVYRAGIDNAGSVDVAVAFDEDLAGKYLAGDGVSDSLLPADKRTVPTVVTIPDGASSAIFEIRLDRAFLEAAAPGSRWAFGLGISCRSRSVRSGLERLVVVFDTSVLDLI